MSIWPRDWSAGSIPALLLLACAPEPSTRVDGALDPGTVRLTTRLGEILLGLDAAAAPLTVANLQAYVDAGFYDGADGLGATVVHRVVPGFVVQGGGLTADLQPKEVFAPVPYEGDNGLRNLQGTVAMARVDDPDSATSQFFINLVDNPALDHHPGGQGYCVFGEVLAGWEVVEAIAAEPAGERSGLTDVPLDPIVLDEVWRGP